MDVLYEDNHIIIVNKAVGEIVQGDKTGDKPLSEMVADYLKEKYQKPGDAFVGVVHRLDRPTSGVVIFAKTSKALARLNDMLRDGLVHKTYWAIVQQRPPQESDRLEHWLVRNEQQNKSYIYNKEKPKSKKAVLDYRLLVSLTRYHLLEVALQTGRHHQIRSQLAHIGCPIKGDLKYGSPRSNPDGSICLHARRVQFVHPVSKQMIDVTAPVPDNSLWLAAEQAVEGRG
ncbi:MAG: RluA family pseudouridine synthase [Bacteroidaceae bacterium]|nr:RluA family pseudouridine synthase [Bacteroidaceae bacterium]